MAGTYLEQSGCQLGCLLFRKQRGVGIPLAEASQDGSCPQR